MKNDAFFPDATRSECDLRPLRTVALPCLTGKCSGLVLEATFANVSKQMATGHNRERARCVNFFGGLM